MTLNILQQRTDKMAKYTIIDIFSWAIPVIQLYVLISSIFGISGERCGIL